MIYFCISNAPPDEAPKIARALVERGLAACVNIVPGVRSIYRWKGELCDDAESTLFIKTADVSDSTFKRVFVEMHPYECPELLVLPIDDGHAAYLDWVREMTTSNRGEAN